MGVGGEIFIVRDVHKISSVHNVWASTLHGGKRVLFGAPTCGLSLAKNSAEKTKYIDVFQPPHQCDELKRH